MSRRWMIVLGVAAALIVAALGAYSVWGDGAEGPGAASPGPLGTDPENSEPSVAGNEDAGDDVLDEPVPMDTVEELFDLVEASGYEPIADETYTVEFVGDQENVRVSGVFADGEDGAEKTFEFSLGEDETWSLDE